MMQIEDETVNKPKTDVTFTESEPAKANDADNIDLTIKESENS